MKAEKRTDILVVGHYVHDTLISPVGERHETLGGPRKVKIFCLHEKLRIYC